MEEDKAMNKTQAGVCGCSYHC